MNCFFLQVLRRDENFYLAVSDASGFKVITRLAFTLITTYIEEIVAAGIT